MVPPMVAIGGNVLQNSKMRVRENFAIFPSKWIFGNTLPCDELTKEAGWKSDCLSDPHWSNRQPTRFMSARPSVLNRKFATLRLGFDLSVVHAEAFD